MSCRMSVYLGLVAEKYDLVNYMLLKLYLPTEGSTFWVIKDGTMANIILQES